MREEPENQGFGGASISWGSILGQDFAEHARRIALVLLIAAIWIGFSPQQTSKPAPQSDSMTVASPASQPAETAQTPLSDRSLIVPVKGIRPDELHDSFSESRGGGRRHEAIDILADRNTPVVAAEGGTIAKIYSSRLGGLSVYEYDPTGRYVYYYAHLDRYAAGLAEGQHLRQGDLIGYVGQTGNAETPHLHFAISSLGSEQKWWQGTPIDPYPLLRNARG